MIEHGRPPITYTPDAAPGGDFHTPESAELPKKRQVAVVTGGSRDVGARLVKRLSELDIDTVVGYNNKAKRANAVAEEIAPFGTNSEFVGADITTPEGIQAIVDGINNVSPPNPEKPEEGQVDFLFLNAASNNRTLNVEANNALIDAVLLKMRPGGKIVFMQSSPGHFNSILAPVGLIPDIYTGVAETKDEAERTIESRMAQFQERGVSVLIAVGPALPDSSNVRMFKSRDAEAAAKFGEIAQTLGIPEAMSMEEFANSVIDVAQNNTDPYHVEFFDPNLLDGRQTLKPIYGETAMYVDVKNTKTGTGRMIVTPERAGKHDEIYLTLLDTDGQIARGEFTVQEDQAEGHFAPESGLPLVLPGHKHIRAAVATMDIFVGLEHPAEEADKFSAGLRGFDQVTFNRPIKPGDEVKTVATLTDQKDTLYTADALVIVGDEIRTEIKGLIVERVENQVANTLLADQIIEFAAQSAAINVFATNPDKRPIFQSIGVTRFFGEDITPGMSLTAQEHTVASDGKRMFSAASIITDQNGKTVGIVDDMRAMIASQTLLKRLLS